MAQVVDEYNVSTEHWCNTNDKIKVKYLEKSLSQCQFVTRTITEPHVIHTHIGIQSDVASLWWQRLAGNTYYALLTSVLLNSVILCLWGWKWWNKTSLLLHIIQECPSHQILTLHFIFREQIYEMFRHNNWHSSFMLRICWHYCFHQFQHSYTDLSSCSKVLLQKLHHLLVKDCFFYEF